MPDDRIKKKEELIELLANINPMAEKLESVGQDIIQHARFVHDAAGPLRELYSQAPPTGLGPEQWTSQVEGLLSWFESARSVQSLSTCVNSFGAISQAVTNTAVSGVMSVYGPVIETEPVYPSPMPLNTPEVQKSKNELFHVLDQFQLVEKARASIRRLGIDSRATGLTSPLEHLEQAHSSLQIPVSQEGGPVAVLISLRECIDASITELIRRRPTQEQAKGWKGKVASLGRHCARPMLDANHFDRVGVEIEKLINLLSGAKQSEIDRIQLMERFGQGVLSLNALLESIDEKLLRPT